MQDNTPPVQAANETAASAVIWNWRESQFAAKGPSTRKIQIVAVIKACIAFGMGALFWYLDWPRLMSYIAFFLGSIVLIAGLFSPHGWLAVLDRGAERSGVWVGNILRWILMPTIYYTVFLPFGKLFRQGRKDALKRYYEPEADSYWETREQSQPEKGSRRFQF